jgi:hypothetical protein
MTTYSILVTNNAPGCNNDIEQQLSVTGCTTYIVRLASNSNALGPFNVYVDSVIYYSAQTRTEMLNGVVVNLACVTPSPTASPSLTPTNTQTPSNGSSPTPTASLTATPTQTPTTTPTPTVTPTNTTTPTVTPTNTTTPTVTPTNTTTPTVTPTNTTTPTQTNTNTPTATYTPSQTPSSTPLPILAYLFIDTNYNVARNKLSSWMQVNQGSITPQFRGYNVAGYSVPANNQSDFDTQMNAFISYTGWTGNLSNGDEPSILSAPICLNNCSGNDSEGIPIQQNIFQTIKVPTGAFTATSSNWCTVFVPVNATPGQKYSTVKNGTSAGGTVARIINSTYNSFIVNYSGATIPAGTYRMYTTYVGTGFSLGTSVLPNYFQGGTLVSA